MEFDSGIRCSAELCNQHDFLPFTCDICKRTFCQHHHLYSDHNCEGNARKDISSMDCQVCGKTVKFNRAQDVDAVWADHNLNFCRPSSSSTSNKSSVRKKCALASCTVHLGPSNTFQCPKCLKTVCLTHRMNEAHNCSAASSKTARNNNFLSQFESKSSSTTSTPKPSSTKKTNQTTDPSNTLKGSTQRRMQGVITPPSSTPTPSTTPGEQDCPLCGMHLLSPDSLLAHFEALHPDPSSSVTPPVPPTSAGGRGEQCPQCNAVFLDPVALVQHFESAHNEKPSSSNNSSDCTVH